MFRHHLYSRFIREYHSLFPACAHLGNTMHDCQYVLRSHKPTVELQGWVGGLGGCGGVEKSGFYEIGFAVNPPNPVMGQVIMKSASPSIRQIP